MPLLGETATSSAKEDWAAGAVKIENSQTYRCRPLLPTEKLVRGTDFFADGKGIAVIKMHGTLQSDVKEPVWRLAADGSSEVRFSRIQRDIAGGQEFDIAITTWQHSSDRLAQNKCLICRQLEPHEQVDTDRDVLVHAGKVSWWSGDRRAFPASTFHRGSVYRLGEGHAVLNVGVRTMSGWAFEATVTPPPAKQSAPAAQASAQEAQASIMNHDRGPIARKAAQATAQTYSPSKVEVTVGDRKIPVTQPITFTMQSDWGALKDSLRDAIVTAVAEGSGSGGAGGVAAGHMVYKSDLSGVVESPSDALSQTAKLAPPISTQMSTAAAVTDALKGYARAAGWKVEFTDASIQQVKTAVDATKAEQQQTTMPFLQEPVDLYKKCAAFVFCKQLAHISSTERMVTESLWRAYCFGASAEKAFTNALPAFPSLTLDFVQMFYIRLKQYTGPLPEGWADRKASPVKQMLTIAGVTMSAEVFVRFATRQLARWAIVADHPEIAEMLISEQGRQAGNIAVPLSLMGAFYLGSRSGHEGLSAFCAGMLPSIEAVAAAQTGVLISKIAEKIFMDESTEVAEIKAMIAAAKELPARAQLSAAPQPVAVKTL